MSIVTSQQITRYFDLFKDVEVTFNKNVIAATGLQTKAVFLKCLGDQWPCIIYSTSMLGARVITNLRASHFETLKRANNLVSLRFSFKQTEKEDPISFFVSAKATSFSRYNKENPDIYFISLTYTQRPPDDLIEILGKLLEANIDSQKRKDKRIIITPETIRKLGLQSKGAYIYIESVPRKCILRDLSYSGAKVLLLGLAKFLINKPAVLQIWFEDKKEPVALEGTIVRYEEVEGRKDIAAVALHFDEDKVPMEYKIRLSDYLKHIKE